MSTSPKVQRLIKRLLRQTESGNLQWQGTDKPTSFLTVLKSGSILVETKDQDGISPYQLVILTSDGVVAERYATVHFERSERDYGDEPPEPESWELELRDLQRAARSQALGIDKTVNELLEELGDDEIPF